MQHTKNKNMKISQKMHDKTVSKIKLKSIWKLVTRSLYVYNL